MKNKRSMILCGLAILFVIAAFLSLLYDNKATVEQYEDLLEGKEPEAEPEAEPVAEQEAETIKEDPLKITTIKAGTDGTAGKQTT